MKNYNNKSIQEHLTSIYDEITIQEIVALVCEDNSLNNENSLFNDLFHMPDYASIQQTINDTFYSFIPKDMEKKLLLTYEKQIAYMLNSFCGKINIDIDKDLSESFLQNNVKAFHLDDFEHMPFKSCIIDCSDIDGANDVLVYKKDNEIYMHLQKIGIGEVSVQLAILDNEVIFIPTASSSFYNSNAEELLGDLNMLIRQVFSYVVSVLLYIIHFNNDSDMVLKNMNYDNYISKYTKKQLAKPKIQNKLQNKKNIIRLDYPANNITYINSKSRGKNKKCITPFLVQGFFRNQRIGPRDNYTINKIWIKPFFKCVYDNNSDFVEKVYNIA